MRGHENVIQVREQGLKPAGVVWLCDHPVKPDFLEWRYRDDGRSPTVCTHGDQLESIDLRFLVGLTVEVCGEDAKRVKALAVKARKAGAESVTASAGGKVAMWKKGDAKWLSF